MEDFHELSDDFSRRFEQQTEKAEKLFLDCHVRSAVQLAKEYTRLARQQQQVINYMFGLFDLMRFGHAMLDPKQVRNAAVELVVLLQDEEQARRIQPDLDEGQYHWVCSWMSSCAYDNLAEATGLMAGFNSPGMHECINDGIQVCRQTGKTDCIKCFREYAADVYLASDDLAMVRHQCQALMEFREDDSSQKDRRCTTLQKLAWVNMLEGRLTRAERDLEQAQTLSGAEKVYLKRRSAILTNLDRHEAHLLLGRTVAHAPEGLPTFEPGEWLRFELELAKLKALALTITGKFEEAIPLLTEWDRRLTDQLCLRDWFEVRLRLIAAYLIQGNRTRAEALGKGLEAKASEAQDYLTLRRWKRLLDPGSTVCPVPLLAEPDAGPWCSDPTAMTHVEEDLDEHGFEELEEDADIVITKTPLSETLSQYMRRIMSSQEEGRDREEILNDLLSHDAASIEDAGDAAYLVHLSRYVIQGSDDALRVWPWAESIRKQFTEDATVLSVVATLGQFLRTADDETFGGIIQVEELEKQFRLSMSMNPNHPRNHSRAGAFFLEEGQHGEAERAYSRACRLDRTDGASAHQLAELYRETDRPRDALAVLDLCLRKGTKDAKVAWEAAMTALQLEQYDMLLIYLDRHEKLVDKIQAWHHYYRGLAQFRLGNLEECLRELDAEQQHRPPGQLHLHAIRFCVYTQLEQLDSAQESLESFLALRLADVDYLSLHGLVRLAEALCEGIVGWPEDHPLRRRLIRRLLRAGLLSDEYLHTLREKNPEADNVHFYRVQVLQPLDESWSESEGCLAGQQEWPHYQIDWGVLAETEDEAVELVFDFQQHCEPLQARLIQVEGSEEKFRDRPGVVWQGYRRHESHSDGEYEHGEHDSDDHGEG